MASGVIEKLSNDSANGYCKFPDGTLMCWGTFSSLPQTISNSKITADMVVLSCDFGTPSALTSDITWTTSAGQLRLTGSMSGTTTAVITLGRTSY